MQAAPRTSVRPVPARLAASPDPSSSPAITPTRRRFRVPHEAVALVAYTLAAFALTANTWRGPAHYIVGRWGDPAQYLWTLSWGPFALSHHLNPFFSTYLNAPEGFNAMWNTPPLSSFVMWPATAAFGPIVSFNLMTTLSFALSAWAMYLALSRITGSATAAGCGGVLYGFGPYMIVQGQTHVALALQVMPPLLLILLHDALVRRQWRARWVGLGIGALLAGQLMTYTEPLVTDCIGTLAILLPLALFNWRRVREAAGHALRVACIAIASAAVLSLPALRTLLFGAQRWPNTVLHPPNIFVIDLLNFVMPTDAHALGSAAASATVNHFTGLKDEWAGYLGVPLLAFLLFGVVRFWRRRAFLIVAIAGLITATLSLGPSLHVGGIDKAIPLPGALFSHIPLVDNLLPARLALMTDFFAALLLAMTMAALAARYTRHWQRAGVLAVTAAVLVPLFPALPYPRASAATPAFFTSSAVDQIPSGSTVLVAPYPNPGYAPELWQVEAGMRFRMPGGYVWVPDGNGGISASTPSVLGTVMANIGHGESEPPLTRVPNEPC